MEAPGKIYDLFPKLRGSKTHRITSDPDERYNCVAWAAGECNAWWEPDSAGESFWPPGVPREYTKEAYIAAFEVRGYVRCGTRRLEHGFEKVALFEENGEPSHAALQLANGKWTSKIGDLEDIEHKLADLEGDFYGRVFQVLKRPRS